MNGLIFFVGTIFILWLGKAIFIPILVAAFIWYLLNSISSYYRKAMPFQIIDPKQITFSSQIFNWISKILSFATFYGLTYLFITQIRPMFSELVIALPEIQQKLLSFTNYISSIFGFSFSLDSLPNMSSIVTSLSSSAAGLLTTTGMVLVYIFFMFIEQSTFGKKFNALIPNKTKSKKLRYILTSIDENMKKYLFMKTFISGAVGLLSYFWLHYIGLEFAGIWAFIIFVMNYIPTIGATIACTLPILYSFTSGDTMNLPILTAVGLIGLQILLGNILEPKLAGKTLNLSTLAILINLVFWGMLWGIAGMFFSVPLLVATFIVTAQFDSTRWIAVLLSANGEIPDKDS